MYAIVRVGGKQYRVEKGDSLVVDRLSEDEGAKVALEPLLLAGNGKEGPVFEPDQLSKVKVEAEVARHERGEKLHVLKFKPKRGYKRRTGHRSELTRLEIKDIKLLTRKPAAGAKKDQEEGRPAAKKEEPEPAVGEAEAGEEAKPKKKTRRGTRGGRGRKRKTTVAAAAADGTGEPEAVAAPVVAKIHVPDPELGQVDAADGDEAEEPKPKKKTRRGTRGGRGRKKKTAAATAAVAAPGEEQEKPEDWDYVPMSEWGDEIGED
jgi:large subunit ribosomal protein L21